MKKAIFGSALFFVSGCLPLGEPTQIVVDGQASLEFEPDTFSLYSELEARGDSQTAALAKLSDQLTSIRETLPSLEGLELVTTNAATAYITPVRNLECLERAGYKGNEHCAIEGYFASITVHVTGSPATISGRALSLVSELGASSVRLGEYSLAEPEQAETEALDAAFKDASAKAQKIAAASGMTIAGPIRIQYGDGFSDASYPNLMEVRSPKASFAQETIAVVPKTDLDLAPQPIQIRAKIVAAFEIE